MLRWSDLSGRGLRKWWGLAMMASCLASAGCAHHETFKGQKEAPSPFRMGIDDVIEVSVYRDPDLTRTVPIRPDGKISLPIVGEMVAAGRTPEEVRAEVVERLHQYVKDPTVISLIVREVHSSRFYVIGEVMKPGVYPLHDATTVLHAIAAAGGAGEFSARDRATVIRATTGQRIVVDLDDPDSAGAFVLKAGDTVVVR